jgi:hypothetical protein
VNRATACCGYPSATPPLPRNLRVWPYIQDMNTTTSTGWLALNLAHAATAAHLDTLARSSDWRIAFQARAAQHSLCEAEVAGEDGGIYRAMARRHIVGLAGALRR